MRLTEQTSNGMPWWVRAITFFGVPSALAMYLTWVLASAVVSEVQDTNNALRDTNSLMKVHIESTSRMELNHQDHERALERILRAICVNGATDANERRECLQ